LAPLHFQTLANLPASPKTAGAWKGMVEESRLQPWLMVKVTLPVPLPPLSPPGKGGVLMVVVVAGDLVVVVVVVGALVVVVVGAWVVVVVTPTGEG
jgi:hypothetical protein